MITTIAVGGLIAVLLAAWGVWENVMATRHLSGQIAALARIIHEGQQTAGPTEYAKAVWIELEAMQARNRSAS